MMLLVQDRERFGERSRPPSRWSSRWSPSAYAVWALYGAGYRSTAWAAMLVMAGIPFYVWLKAQAGQGADPAARGAG